MVISKSYIAVSAISTLVLPAVVLYVVFSRDFWPLGYAVAIALVVLSEVAAYFLRYRKTEIKLSLSLRSALYSLSWLSVYFWIPNFEIAAIYSVCAAPLFFTSRILFGFGSETVISAQTLLTAAGFSVLPFALEQYLSLESGLLTLLIFAWQFLLSYFTFSFTPRMPRTRVFHALLIALLGVEVYAVLLFLPFHFTTLGLLLFLSYYWLWLMVFQHLAGVLTAKKIKFYSILITVLFLSTVFLTSWDPL